MTATAPLRVARAAGVLELTLCGPPVNPLSVALVETLEAAVAGVTEEVRAVAIVSDVPRVFMAGADLQLLRSRDRHALRDYVRRLQVLFTAIERLPVPVVAGIDGACLGGGLELALCCDVRVVSPGARLGLPEVTLGLLPGAGGTQRLVRALGQGVARDLMLTGRRIDGEQAVRWGLAGRLVDEDEAGPTALQIARALAAGAGPAQRAIKRLALDASELSMEEGLRSELDRWSELHATDEAREGIDAFLTNRPPRFA